MAWGVEAGGTQAPSLTLGLRGAGSRPLPGACPGGDGTLGSPSSRSRAIQHCLQIQGSRDPSVASSLPLPPLHNSGTWKGDLPRAAQGTGCMDRPVPSLLFRAQLGTDPSLLAKVVWRL